MFAYQENLAMLLAYSASVGTGLGVFCDCLRVTLDFVLPRKNQTVKEPKRLPSDEKSVNKAMFGIDKRIRARDVGDLFGDLCFFTVSGFSVAVLLFHLNYGQVRLFSLVSAFAGFVLYRYTVGKAFSVAAAKILSAVKAVVFKVLKLLCFPIYKLCRKLVLPIFERRKKHSLKRRARKYIELMERRENQRIQRRNNEYERNKGVCDKRNGKGAVS